jgi:nucleoid-associated protein YgaU
MANEALTNLVKAKIVEVDKDSDPKYMEKTGGLSPLTCMFNPYEYTVTQSNAYIEYHKNKAKHADSVLRKTGSQTLTLSLIFDTYEQGTDVREHTDKLWEFMRPKEKEIGKKIVKIVPPYCAFIWGEFYFVAKITSVTQRFILFKHDGTPVRAKVDVVFTQNEDIDDHPPTNPTSGGGPITRIWKVTEGDRLDLIAVEMYQDASLWRSIAQYNHIRDPLALKPGQLLYIPVN